MTRTAAEVVEHFLANTTDPAVVEALVAADATYISLNDSDPDLQRILPWAGTWTGPERFVFTFAEVARFWQIEDFQVLDTVADDERVAVFGRFTYRSKTLGQSVTSPFSILAKVSDEKITYFQFMEDTFATARSFRSGGTWTVQADPDGAPFEV